ncbi:hypothetical protein ACHAWF_000912 [Thalassiosira exigua]
MKYAYSWLSMRGTLFYTSDLLTMDAPSGTTVATPEPGIASATMLTISTESN